MRVDQVYTTDVLTVDETSPLISAARVMEQATIGAVAVIGGANVGIISERDIVRAVAQGADVQQTQVKEYASYDVKTASVDADTVQVAHEMLDHGIRHLPVVRGGETIGIVSMRDLLAVETWA